MDVRTGRALGRRYWWNSHGRFKGGFITRHYGDPAAGIHALQLELAQRAYMHETSLEIDKEKASQLRATLSVMLDAYQQAASE